MGLPRRVAHVAVWGLAALAFAPAAAQEPAALPNLVLLAGGPSSSPARGDPVTFEAVVANAGDGNASASVLRFLVDGQPFADVATPPLAPGASAGLAAPSWLALPGNHSWALVADATGLVAESVESDNVRSGVLHVREPDLVVRRLDAVPGSPAVGQRVRFVVEIANRGDAPAVPFEARVTLDDGTRLAAVTVEGLAAGHSVTITTASTLVLVPGERSATARADVADAVLESSESNNVRVRAFTVRVA